MHIEIWSDFVCPFCYIGKHHFETALNHLSQKEQVKVSFKSFQLDPNTPPYNGINYYESLAKKFGSLEQAKEMTANIAAQAKDAGLEFDFDQAKSANTLDAHRLSKLAETQNVQQEVTELLFRGHFIEGKDIGSHETLLSIATKAGLDETKVKEVLSDDSAFLTAVKNDIEEAKQLGISGVPNFVINRKYSLSGAQPVEAFTEAMEKVLEEENSGSPLQSISPEINSGDACGDDGCDIPEKSNE